MFVMFVIYLAVSVSWLVLMFWSLSMDGSWVSKGFCVVFERVPAIHFYLAWDEGRYTGAGQTSCHLKNHFGGYGLASLSLTD